MKVCEIFSSIQGESSFSGFPCVFIRLTGCNLRCSYCDTAYAYDEGSDIKFSEILERIKSFGIGMVEVTGGEPLLQEETHSLIENLLDDGFRVLLETNGSMGIENVDKRAHIVLDIKTPSSKMSERMYMKNLECISKKDDLKFVMSNREDYDWAERLVKEYSLTQKTNVFFSPVFGILDPGILGQWIIRDRLGVRLGIQLHKFIYDPDKRGV
jgi:7-carboxy-7-deazaguanine synthase